MSLSEQLTPVLKKLRLSGIQDHCRTKIAGFKVPRQLNVVGTMQRSPSGKADYRWAQSVASGEIDSTEIT